MRFLIAIDGSTQSEIVLRFSAQFVRYADEPFTLLTVIEHHKDRQRAEAMLINARELLESEGGKHLTKIRVGHPAEEIISEMEECDYGLVVVGEGKHRNLATRFLLGSTSIRIAEHAPCSVIIVKGIGNPIRRILLCDSGAEKSLMLSHFTSLLAGLLGDELDITVLHVMSQISAWPGISDRQLRANAKDLIAEHSLEGKFLRQDIKILEQPGIYSNPKVRHGLVVDEILAEAQSGDYDLVVIGAHKSEGWQHLLLDDLARKIMIHSHRSVLVVK